MSPFDGRKRGIDLRDAGLYAGYRRELEGLAAGDDGKEGHSRLSRLTQSKLKLAVFVYQLCASVPVAVAP